MHMADALLTPAVAGVMYAASAVVAGASIVELHKEEKQDLTSAAKKLPTMAVMSALVFAGQMINYTIPGTGSSGHLCGGLLLTSVLGPWAGFLSMIVILTIQCLFFADGGLLALGANVWNMAFYGCFVGYFLIYRPLMRSRCFARRGERAANRLKITLASVLGCVLTLQLGAFSVVLETTLSGITDLPFGAFCAIMQPIHLAIGLIGVPVFSGYGAGLAKVAGPTGGYLVGYLLLAFIGGLFIEKSNGQPVVSAVGLVLGDAACYVLGTAWFVFQMQCDLSYALAVCVYPFIVLDLAKIVVSCIVGALLRKRLVQAGVLHLKEA